MAELLTPYQPDLEKIARESEIHEPKMFSQREYEKLCLELGWNPGAKLERDSILQAMEHGVIRIWHTEIVPNTSTYYDVLKRVGPTSADLTLGPESWTYKEGNVPHLILGEHQQAIRENDLLDYSYSCPNSIRWFQNAGVVLALTQESLALSNIIEGDFDGRSTFARIGGSNHQTAGGFEPGFIGQPMMELSNTNKLPIGVRVLDGIAALRFDLLNRACTKPRNLDSARNWTTGQGSPFGWREPEWDVIRKNTIRRCLASGQKDHIHKLSA